MPAMRERRTGLFPLTVDRTVANDATKRCSTRHDCIYDSHPTATARAHSEAEQVKNEQDMRAVPAAEHEKESQKKEEKEILG